MLSISRPNRSCASALTHHFTNSQAFCLVLSSFVATIMQHRPSVCAVRSMAPSSFIVPGKSVKSHRPRISGADTISVL